MHLHFLHSLDKLPYLINIDPFTDLMKPRNERIVIFVSISQFIIGGKSAVHTNQGEINPTTPMGCLSTWHLKVSIGRAIGAFCLASRASA